MQQAEKVKAPPFDCYVAVTDRGEAWGWHEDRAFLEGFVAAVNQYERWRTVTRSSGRCWAMHEYETLRVVSRAVAEDLGLKAPFWARVGEWT